MAYEVELLVEQATIHQVFHILLLKKRVGDPTSKEQSQSMDLKASITY